MQTLLLDTHAYTHAWAIILLPPPPTHNPLTTTGTHDVKWLRVMSRKQNGHLFWRSRNQLYKRTTTRVSYAFCQTKSHHDLSVLLHRWDTVWPTPDSEVSSRQLLHDVAGCSRCGEVLWPHKWSPCHRGDCCLHNMVRERKRKEGKTM